MVAGEAEIASIIAIRPPSMRLAISISPSRVSSSTVPISRMYMRTGSVVRPNSLSTVDRAASASSSASSSVAAVGVVLFSSSVSASGVCSYTATPMSLSIDDHDFQRLGIDQLLGQVVGDFGVRQVAARLAQRDQRLQALAALGHFLFGQDGFVQAEFLHQGAFLRLADLHAQRLDLLGDLRPRPPVRCRRIRPRCRARSTPRPAGLPAASLGLRPRLAPALARAPRPRPPPWAGGPVSSSPLRAAAAALAVFLGSSLAEALSGLAGDFVGTGLVLSWLRRLGGRLVGVLHDLQLGLGAARRAAV